MLPYTVLNAFAAEPLTGNPVAVFHDACSLSGETMQAVARQLQLSETTFILESDREEGPRVRIFTPVNELPFAGHPMIGTAALVARLTGRTEMKLETLRGWVSARVVLRDDDVAAVAIRMPPAERVPFDRDTELLSAIGLEGATLPIALYDSGARHVLVAVASHEALRAIQPNYTALHSFENMAINCFSLQDGHVENRMFSPAYGIREDAGTGSAVAPILQYLKANGHFETGKRLRIDQGHALGRLCRMYGQEIADGSEMSIELSGEAVVFAECELRERLLPEGETEALLGRVAQ